jgi:FimV-like protein
LLSPGAYRALFTNGNSAAELLTIRAETLYWLGRRNEAMAVLKDALLLKPHGYKIQLQLARLLAEAGDGEQARGLLEEVLKKHKDVLLPRVYNYALVARDGPAARALYKRYLAELDEEVFGQEPSWPPNVDKPVMEMWRRDDLEFLVPFFSNQGKK